jgi:aromatic ring-opening dioxygenase catalytic subunit (LigB family)
MGNDGKGISRRAVVAGIATATAAGAAGVAAVGQKPGGNMGTSAQPGNKTVSHSSERLPVVYLPHGGGPWPFMDMPIGSPEEFEKLTVYLQQLKVLPKTPPKALLVVSAHWEEPVPTVMSSPKPPMLFDYYGFPPETDRLTWPAPGNPELAQRVRGLLEKAGFQTGADAARGFDHGTFVPLKLTYPQAEIPTVQLSLKEGLNPAEHLAMGRALAPLRDEGVFIIGSGMSYHNMRGFGPGGRASSETFDAWLREAVAAEPGTRDELLSTWASAPAARQCHPREEHLLPLMVIAGAAGADKGVTGYSAPLMGVAVSAFHFG